MALTPLLQTRVNELYIPVKPQTPLLWCGEIVVVDIEVILQRDPIIPARGIGGIVAKAANARVRAGIVVLQVYFFDGTQINGCIRSKKKWKNIGVNQVIIFSSTLPSAFLKLQI